MVELVGSSRNHHVFRLQQASHHIQHGCFAYVDGLLFWYAAMKWWCKRTDDELHFCCCCKITYIIVGGQWSVTSHQKMKLRRWNQWCGKTDQRIVHIRRISQCSCADWHNGGDQRIDLREARILYEGKNWVNCLTAEHWAIFTSMCKRSVAMRFKAVLSNTTTQSAQVVSRLSVSIELYGCTTTSLEMEINFNRWTFPDPFTS